MASVAERKRKHRAAAPARKAQAKAKPELTLIQGGHQEKPAPVLGLDWMLAKRKLSRIAVAAGKRYGKDFRLAEIDGLNPLRSCLNDEPRGAGAASLPRAVMEVAAGQQLAEARAALHYHPGMVSACDLVCGRGLTPWEVIRQQKGKQRDAERLMSELAIALHILSGHYKQADLMEGSPWTVRWWSGWRGRS